MICPAKDPKTPINIIKASGIMASFEPENFVPAILPQNSKAEFIRLINFERIVSSSSLTPSMAAAPELRILAPLSERKALFCEKRRFGIARRRHGTIGCSVLPLCKIRNRGLGIPKISFQARQPLLSFLQMAWVPLPILTGDHHSVLLSLLQYSFVF